MCEGDEMRCRKPICAYCGSQKTVLASNQKVKDIFIQEHKCRACGKMFCLSKNIGKELIRFIDKNKKSVSPSERISYPQDWPAYNEAQTNEKGQLIQILSELNSLLEVEYRKRRGIAGYDFCLCHKSLFSSFKQKSCFRIKAAKRERLY